MRLSFEIVKIYHGENRQSAEENFCSDIPEKGMPEDSVQVQISTATLLRDLLLQEKLVSSKTDFKRLVDRGRSLLSEDNFIIQDQDFLATAIWIQNRKTKILESTESLVFKKSPNAIAFGDFFYSKAKLSSSSSSSSFSGSPSTSPSIASSRSIPDSSPSLSVFVVHSFNIKFYILLHLA